MYYYFGKEYIKIKDVKIKDILISHSDLKIYEPVVEVDQLEKAYKKINKKVLIKELNLLREKYKDNIFVDISNISLKTRYMNTRFGSCNPKLRTININLYLIHYNLEYLEYVFLHEITHLVHHNHSKEYYALLKKLSPNYVELKKELNNKFIQR
jgi:predicted metal-dependent hydrolase